MDNVDEMKIVTGDVAGEERRQNGMSQVDGIKLPRVSIQFCTQCKWMLRAAYFAQELLSTFGTDIGEVALQPSTGGTFIVELFTDANANKTATSNVEREAEKNVDEVKEVKVLKHTLWDRKSEGGFPEQKVGLDAERDWGFRSGFWSNLGIYDSIGQITDCNTNLETKELKKRLRNIIDPSRDLGHVDGKKSTTSTATPSTSNPAPTNPLPSSAQQDSAPTAIKASTSSQANTVSQPPAASPATTSELIEAKPEEVKEKKQEEEKVTLNERGKIVITGLKGEGGFGVCRPGDEDCGGF
ncbi:uncharacterized protein EAF02_011439 [Botrytis sinoallii]|uniref:uncharacterized protein n=1 Tax=Botrytis sinoallii TaxID=1463999 RepID=UPI00190272D8|nr:uncharacterized protein EAF02_011439 [Botrytis sinoallii]KAF7856180.1 hypothetical protein EAF02_011439 [Botrytis sinoallii]